jgi:hypothetical protein
MPPSMNDTATQPRFRLPVQPEYDHVQYAPLYWLMLAPAFFLMWAAIVLANSNEEALALLAVSALIGLVAYSMHHMRVYDDGDALVLRYGPIPLFRKRTLYGRIAAVERDRSNVLDGWGIHWVPGRGWTYNLWGFDCVRLTLTNGRTVRIGTDDPEGLAEFLNRKRSAPP